MLERTVKIHCPDELEEIEFLVVRNAIAYLSTWSYNHYERVEIYLDDRANISADFYIKKTSNKVGYHMYGERPRNLADPKAKYSFNS